MTTTDTQRIRLGILMIDAGLITRDDLEECLAMAKETGLPVGKIFLLSGKTSEPVLLATVQAQSLLKDGIISLETSYKALKKVAQSGLTLDEALKQLKVEVDDVKVNKLGELLVEANFVSEEQLNEALEGSADTGLPFGRMLVLNGIINEAQLAATLNAQILVRDQKITKEQAIEGLKQARRRQIAVEVPLMEKGFYTVQPRESVRLGELLTLSGMVSESQILSAVELGLVSQKPLGKVLTEQNLVSESVLRIALKIQELVEAGTLKPAQAAEVMTKSTEGGLSIPDAVASIQKQVSPDNQEVSLKDFLFATHHLTDQELQTAFEKSVNNNQILGRILLSAGLLDENSLQAAMRLVFLVKGRVISQTDASKAFEFCLQNKVSIDEALARLDIKI
ncbi:MAG: hypothetical protein R3F51_23000 [Cyanobacteriota/Melainabacteria group bacterium]